MILRSKIRRLTSKSTLTIKTFSTKGALHMKPRLMLAKGSSYYMSSRLSVGVVMTKDKKAILIDSGIDKGIAKEVNNAIKAAGATVGAIINTHFHADHCGGNHFFQKEYKDN